MNNKHYFSFNSLDKFLLILISAFLTHGFLLWLISNIFRINDLFVWFAMLPLSIYLSYSILNTFSFQHTALNRQTLLPYLIFFSFLTISALYLLQPIWTNPYATIGIPNKDLHDGIAAFISNYGYPPVDKAFVEQSAFIPNAQNGHYLGYPNGLHVFTAFFNKFGAFAFHTTWIALTVGLLITSLSLFLLSKAMLNNDYVSAVIAGLFVFSSFRISYGAIASIPMLFSYTLVIPCLLLCLFTIYHTKSRWAYLIPAMGLSFLAASYSGIILFVFGLLLLYEGFLFLTKDTERLKNTLQLILWSLPLLTITFLMQKGIYWQNTFPTIRDYDPYELSQRILPLDKPLYMLVYFISICVLIFTLLKEKLTKKTNLLKVYILLINLGFLSFIVYDILFHRINGVTTSEQLITTNPDGFFGGLNHQKVARLALLQPFFFILLIGEFTLLIKNTLLKIGMLTVIIALFFFIRVDLPLYQPIAPEVASSFYNQTGTDKPYTLLSHTRLIVNDQIWSKDIIDGLNYLKDQEISDNTVLIWDERNWTEETITGWGSVYLKQKLLKTQDMNIQAKIMTPDVTQTLENSKIQYLLLLYPTEATLYSIINNTLPMQIVWQNGNVYVVKLQN